jgi:hypothetical protein
MTTKRILLIVLAMALSALIGARIHAQDAYDMTRTNGDITGDGVVSWNDAHLILLSMNEQWAGTPLEYRCAAIHCGDVDMDGAITHADYRAVLRYVVGQPSYHIGEPGCSVSVAAPPACVWQMPTTRTYMPVVAR